MLLFLPVLILISALFFLVASNLFQRDFRSSWLVTVTGSGLALASLIFLRLRIPLSSNFSAWWAGEGLVSSISFSLDENSWLIAFIVSGLLLAIYLTEVDRAIIAPWLRWAVILALAVASLLAVFSGDFLTLAFFWVLVDAFTTLALFRFIENAEERREALSFLPINITSSFLLIAAWILAGYSGQIGSVVAILAASLRLGIFSPLRASNLGWTQAPHLRLLPLASVFVLLSRSLFLEEFPQTVVLILLMLPALLIAFQLNQQENKTRSAALFERGFAVMAIAAAAIGQPLMALGFGQIVLVSGILFTLARYVPRWRWLIVSASTTLFAVQPFLSVSSDRDLPIIFFVFLVIEAALIFGRVRFAQQEDSLHVTGEPWMQVTSVLGFLVVPIFYFLLLTGWAPTFSTGTGIGWLPATIVIVLSVGFFVLGVRTRKRFVVPARLAVPVESIVSMRWIESAIDRMFMALGWVLRMMSRVLEGQAGVLWALLLIVLLLSLASQFAIGG